MHRFGQGLSMQSVINWRRESAYPSVLEGEEQEFILQDSGMDTPINSEEQDALSVPERPPKEQEFPDSKQAPATGAGLVPKPSRVLLSINLLLLLMTTIAMAAWIEIFTDWGPELGEHLVIKAGGAAVSLALLIWLGKNYDEVLTRITRLLLGKLGSTVAIIALVVACAILTASARTVEISGAKDADAEVMVNFIGKQDVIKVEAKAHKRLVYFSSPFRAETAKASVACRRPEQEILRPYKAWSIDLEKIARTRQLVVRGSEKFSAIFSGGAIAPLDLVLHVGSQEFPVARYTGQPVIVGECACQKSGQAQCIRQEFNGNIKIDSDPNGLFICRSSKPCIFYASGNRQVVYKPGIPMPARLIRVTDAGPGPSELWQITMEWIEQ